ncbi:hypothetical protein O7606_22255 [Micromonospora sp. WMMD882]|uniref:hypothetical protein n=1 Tax=Micromonospora sp. WMMD882 TaxID=3015151 RepID=UPI00248C7D5D|nr:hypothetical protein [Micromonospora sp. WMMD882]WBB78895.1 hypothetical protein O7606_22255 [Micromonospora sp. WMMD882]
MTPSAESRPGTPLLAGLTVLASLLGGWWWTAADPRADAGAENVPAVGEVLAGPFARPDPARLAAARRAASSYHGGGPDRPSRPDPVSVAEPRPGRTAVVDPSSGGSTGRRWGGLARVLTDPEADASRLGTVLWREDDRLLTADAPEASRQVTGAPDVRYLLLARCAGPGEVTVAVHEGGIGRSWQPVRCDGALLMQMVEATGGPLTVRFSHSADGVVELDAVLLRQG